MVSMTSSNLSLSDNDHSDPNESVSLPRRPPGPPKREAPFLPAPLNSALDPAMDPDRAELALGALLPLILNLAPSKNNLKSFS